MKMKLRPYQERAVIGLTHRLLDGTRVLAVSPTGSGKTVIAAATIYAADFKRVLWIAHRIELLRQARAQLIAAGLRAEDVGILSGKEQINVDARVLVVSIDTIRTRDIPEVDLIVIDEAHRAPARSYSTVLEACPGVPVLGLTATPWRLDGQALGDVFEEMIVMAGHADLILAGYIAHPITYGVPLAKARKIVAGLKKTDGDYSLAALGRRMTKKTLMGKVVEDCARIAPGQRTIVYACHRAHGKALTKEFKRKKRPTEYLDGDTDPVTRAGILERLALGVTEVVVNVDVLAEGIDVPAVKCIVLARPTKSLTRYLQYVGRAARPYKDTRPPYKDIRPAIVDNAGNTWEHGLPEFDREWSLDGRLVSLGLGNAPVKMCAECGVMIPVSAMTCPECGAVQPRSEKEIREERATLERLKASEAEKAAMLKRVEGVAEERGLSQDWIDKVMKRLLEAA